MPTKFRHAVPADLRVALALYYMAHNVSRRTSAAFFRRAGTTLKDAFDDFVNILDTKFKSKYIVFP